MLASQTCIDRQLVCKLRRFNICLAKPDNYIHSYAFLELGELLAYSLRELGYDTTLNFKNICEDRINILIGFHLLSPSLIPQVPKSTIILNTEQIYFDDSAWNNNIFEWARCFEVWDYSERNIERLQGLGLRRIKYLRIGFQKELQRIKKSKNRDIDVLFYGSISERRIRVIEALRESGLKVETLFGIYGAQRDSVIARSKIILNHHTYSSEIFEIVRVFYLLHNEMAVVAEINDTTSIEDRWRDAVMGVKYDQLVDACIGLSKDESARSDLETRGAEIIKKFPQVDFMSEILEV